MTNETGNVEQLLNLDNDDSLLPSEMLRTICDIKLLLLLHIKLYVIIKLHTYYYLLFIREDSDAIKMSTYEKEIHCQIIILNDVSLLRI